MPPTQKQNVLFICSRNQWRSPTAEAIFKRHPALNVRSAGTSDKAKRKVTESDIAWAHTIFAIETKHRRQLQKKFGHLLADKTVIDLDIPDDYQFMDPELVEVLTIVVTHALVLE
jgi:predicted protein tyrosine phosphatase